MASQTNEQILQQIMREGGVAAQSQAAKAIKDLKDDLTKSMKENIETTNNVGRVSKRAADVQDENVKISKVAAENIKLLKDGQKQLIALTQKTNGLLSNLLSESSKYYESNNELLRNLLTRDALHSEKAKLLLKDAQASVKAQPSVSTGGKSSEEGGGAGLLGDALTMMALKKMFGKGESKASATEAQEKTSPKIEEAEKPTKTASSAEDRASSGRTAPRVKTDYETMAEEARSAKRQPKSGSQRVEPTLSTEPEPKAEPKSDLRAERTGRKPSTFEEMARVSESQKKLGLGRVEPTLSVDLPPQASQLAPEVDVKWNEKAGRFQRGNSFISFEEAKKLGFNKPGTITPLAASRGPVEGLSELKLEPSELRAPPKSTVTPKGGGTGALGGGLFGAAIGIISGLASNAKLEDVQRAKAKVQEQLANGEITIEQANEAFKELDVRAARARGEVAAYSGLKEGISGAFGAVAGTTVTPVVGPVGGAGVGLGAGMILSEGIEDLASRSGVKGVLQKAGEYVGEKTGEVVSSARDKASSLTGGYISSSEEARRQDIMQARKTAEEEEALKNARNVRDRYAAQQSKVGIANMKPQTPEELALFKKDKAAYIRSKEVSEDQAKQAEETIKRINADVQARSKKLEKMFEPQQKLTNESIDTIDTTPASSSPTVIRQGDTINNVVNNSGAAGGSLATGHFNSTPRSNPWDDRLYGRRGLDY